VPVVEPIMTIEEALVLLLGGLIAGVINAIAGGGSLITVPLLVMTGLPGTIANGTNRIGVLVQSVAGALQFRADGVSGFRASLPVLWPLTIGSAVGALAAAHISDTAFERIFAVVMVVMLVPVLRGAKPNGASNGRVWSPRVATAVFFAIGVYGGAIQAGVGLLLLLALSRSGYDLVKANSIKLVVIAVFTSVAVVVFVAQGQVVWAPALLLALATAAGAVVGARLAVRGGERVIRPVLVVSVLLLATRMLGLY
jgi:uncharacterized membrane protein YfcA